MRASANSRASSRHTLVEGAPLKLPPSRTCIHPCRFADRAAVVAGPLAYVPNEGSASISVIDTATDKVSATLKVGRKPRGIALSADGARSIVSDQTANALVVSNGQRARRRDDAARRLAGGHLPLAGRKVAGRGDRGERPGPARRHDDEHGRAQHQDAGKNPSTRCGVRTANGSTSVPRRPTASTSSTSRGEVVKSVKVGDRPRGIGFLPDGTRAYVAAENADTVNVFDVAKHESSRDQGGQPLERRHRSPGRQARVRLVRRQGHRAGDRHRDQHDRRRRWPSAAGRGTWRSRRMAASSTSPAADRMPSRSSTPPPTEDRARSPSASCPGAWRSADAPAGAAAVAGRAIVAVADRRSARTMDGRRPAPLHLPAMTAESDLPDAARRRALRRVAAGALALVPPSRLFAVGSDAGAGDLCVEPSTSRAPCRRTPRTDGSHRYVSTADRGNSRRRPATPAAGSDRRSLFSPATGPGNSSTRRWWRHAARALR